MKRWMHLAAAAALLLTLTACYPEKRVVWSPDGRRAAVIGADGLHLCDPEGNLSPLLVADAKRAVWFPDSRRLALVVPTEVETWSELVERLSAAQREEIEAYAVQLRAQILAFTGDWDDFEPVGVPETTPGEVMAAALLKLRDEDDGTLAAHVGEEKWGDVKDLSVGLFQLTIARVTETGALGEQVVLQSSIGGIGQPRIAPDGKAILYTEGGAGEPGLGRLLVAPVEPGRPLFVSDSAAFFPDWTPDSRAVVFIRSAGPPQLEEDALVLGVVSQAAVRDETGALRRRIGKEMDLAGVLFSPLAQVRCLDDGRILFSAFEVSLPAASADMPTAPTLFAVNPAVSPVVARVLPRRSEARLSEVFGSFEPSPDGRYVCIPQTDGTIQVVELATGEARTLFETGSAMQELKMIPTWRTASELCCVVPGAEGGRHEIALISIGEQPEPRIVSADWPEEVSDWLTERKIPTPTTTPAEEESASQPAPAPAL